MSLGQLTADYADSDVEDEQPIEQKKPSTKTEAFKSKIKVPSPPPPPILSPLRPSENSKVAEPEKEVDKQDTSKKDDLQSSPKSSPKEEISSGLSGVIIDEDDDDRSTLPSPAPQRVGELKGGGEKTSSPASGTGSLGSNKDTPVKKINRLVSYYNEEDDMDDSSDSADEPDELLNSEPMDTGTDGEEENSNSQAASLSGGSRGASHPSSPHAGAAEGGPVGGLVIQGIKIPPAPSGRKCSQALQDKLTKAVADVRRGNKDYNAMIQNNKEFRNPSIYEKLVDHLRLDENGTNYPVALYDPHCWGKESFYEELARSQKEEMEKREKERKERTKVDLVSGTKRSSGAGGGGDEEIKKRKSRFDAGRPDTVSLPAVTKPVSLVSNLSASSLVTKTTIDAFGSLAKKPKPLL